VRNGDSAQDFLVSSTPLILSAGGVKDKKSVPKAALLLICPRNRLNTQ
jgi:hypothetical protein